MGCDTLIGKISLGSSTVHARKTPWVKYSTRLKVAVTVARVRVGLRSEPYTCWQLCHQCFSHGPMQDHKALVAPDPTHSGSLNCKSLLASHCAVSQTTVSSDDCAINTSMNGCYPYVASIYVRLSNVTIHPYLHCGGNWFLLLFIAVIKHHP